MIDELNHSDDDGKNSIGLGYWLRGDIASFYLALDIAPIKVTVSKYSISVHNILMVIVYN